MFKIYPFYLFFLTIYVLLPYQALSQMNDINNKQISIEKNIDFSPVNINNYPIDTTINKSTPPIKDEEGAKNDSVALKKALRDSLHIKKITARKEMLKNAFNFSKNKTYVPKIATIFSTAVPGLGQAYNHQFWKIPIVWAAIGTPIGFLIYNTIWYQRTAFAYNAVVNNDTPSIKKIFPLLQGLSATSLQYYRNQFRKNRDYSILFTVIMWGLNVADAAVSAHLRNFDISPSLTMHIQPMIASPLPIAYANNVNGLDFILDIHSPKPKLRRTIE